MPVATVPIVCGHCGRSVGAEIVYVVNANPQNFQVPTYVPAPSETIWLRCPMCGGGSVRGPLTTGGVVWPGELPSRDVLNLPSDVATAWSEARAAHSVGAYTAAEMMCRKILMHLAVDVAGSPSGKTFAQYVADLQAGNYIMAGLTSVVDQVRDRGNKANHELPASTKQDSLTTLSITEHLLAGIYELPALGGQSSASAQGATTPSTPATGTATVT